MSNPISEITTSLRKRVHSSKYLSDAELWEIALFAGCNDAQELIEYAFCRRTASELADKLGDVSLTNREWDMAFSGGTWDTASLTADLNTSATIENVKHALVCTLQEHEQSRRWACPINRMLVYIALHSKDDTEKRVESVLGELVRTDTRKLDDVRADIISETERVTSITKAASIVTHVLKL